MAIMKNIFTTGCACYLEIPLVLLLVGFFSNQATAQCDVANALTVPSTYFNSGYAGNGNFNAIVFGSFSTSDGLIGGRLAVGGNFTNTNVEMENYFIGKAALAPVSSDNLVVNGQLINNLGGQITVRGNAKYGSLGSGSTAPAHDAGEGTNSVASNLISFTSLLTHYTGISNNYAALSPTVSSSAAESPAGVLNLTGNGTPQNYVFNITLNSPLLREVIFTNIPAGSGILINILNSGTVQIDGSEASGPMATNHTDNTLFNFPNAQNVLINEFDFQGSVLMPSASTVSVTNGDISGVFITGGSVTQATNFNILNSCLAYPLPVTLAKFSAQKEGNTTLLNWQTTSDVNAVKFEIERSQGKNKKWQVIGERAVQVSAAPTKSYTFTDTNPLSKTNLYRLKMSDKDGTFSYSRLVEVYFENIDGVKTFPNPVTETLSITTEGNRTIKSISATNITGREYPAKLVDGNNVTVSNWPAGIYILKLTTDDGVVTTKKVIKN